MTTRTRYTMSAITVYLALLGAVFAFAPGFAESSMEISLPDPARMSLYGQVLLALAVIAYLLSGSQELPRLCLGFVALFGSHILVFAYQIGRGVQTFALVGPPLIIPVIFSGLLVVPTAGGCRRSAEPSR